MNLIAVVLKSAVPSFKDIFRKIAASDFLIKVGQTLATRITLIGLGLLTTVLIARILGPEGRGLYAVATTIGAIGVQFGNFGLHASNTYTVARDRSLLPQLVGNTLAISFGAGSAGTLAMWLIFLTWPSLAPVKGLLLPLALLWIPFGLAYLLLQNILIGIHEIGSYNKIELYGKCLAVLFLFILIGIQVVTVETLLISGLIALIISVCWTYGRIRPHLACSPSMSYATFKNTFYYGLKSYFAAFFAFITIKINILIIQYMLGSEQTGYFSIASTISDLITMLPVVVGTIMFPKLSGMNGKLERYSFARRTAIAVGIVMALIVSISVILAEPIVRILFGADFVPAVPAFLWLMPGIFICSVNTILMNYFASSGMPIITVYSPACAAAAATALAAVLIPKYGIVGASAATSVAFIIMFVFSLSYIYRTRGFAE